MKTFSEFLFESWSTSSSEEHKNKHHDQVHKILTNAYKAAGGYGGHKSDSAEEHAAISADIHHSNHVLKVNHVNGHVTSVAIYKQQHGRKLIALGHDNSVLGRTHLHKLVHEDNKQKRSWAELSGAAEHLYKKHDVPAVSNEHAEHLTNKVIHTKNTDGSYVRAINGVHHTKTIYGHPQLKES